MAENIDGYLKNAGIDNGRIARRYRVLLEALYKFFTVKNIVRNAIIDHKTLKTAIYDFFVDIAKIKVFHNIDRVNFEKIYSYTAYWLLRRKPIKVTTPFNGCEFINELFITSFLISNMLSVKKLNGSKCAENTTFKDFQSLLFYNLKYRPLTQQSLELMVEAFFCGCDFRS